ncbi:MAG: hypothetical protein P8Y53_01195 [Pseudolabrys sp.]
MERAGRRATADSNEAAAWLDLSTIAHLQGWPDDRLALQSVALKLCRLYHQPPATATARPLRLLALMAPGDFMANIPIEFMVAGSDVALDMLYLVEDEPLPPLPEHDVALVAIAEQRANQALLGRLATQAWPKPLLNAPAHIARRHARAFAAIAERFALDYVPFDCGETPDGQLLVFEAGTNMIVHSMDPPELFPYKPPQMQKVFGAFQTMLRDACEMQADAAVA